MSGAVVAAALAAALARCVLGAARGYGRPPCFIAERRASSVPSRCHTTLAEDHTKKQQQQQQQQQRQRRRDNILSRLDLARRLVNACPTASLGYLHYARIMEEQGQYEAAVRIYDNALEKVHKGDPYIQNLQPRRLELVSQYLNLRTLGRLPVEIIDYIMLNFLSVTDRVHCAQTCKAWKHMIMDSNVMWQDIDFRKLNPRMLFYQLYNKSLRKITLGYSSRFTLLCPTGVVIPSRSNYIEELVLDLGTARFYTGEYRKAVPMAKF